MRLGAFFLFQTLDNIMPWLVLLLATMSWTCIVSSSLWDCKDSSDCDPQKSVDIKFARNPTGPNFYSPPGPIKLRCDATGDVQYIRWTREGRDNRSYSVKSTTFKELRSLHWEATLTNYLLGENFPYKYQCIAYGKCCKSAGRIGTSTIKTVEKSSTAEVQDQVCVKDVLIILDTSGSVGSKFFHDGYKRFVSRLVDDKRLNVSRIGSHIAIMTFSDTVHLELSFAQGQEPSHIEEVVKSIPYKAGRSTRTGLALGKANEIFTKKKESNRQYFHYNDVIVLVTDGKPTDLNLAIAESKKLQNKGVSIIGVFIKNRYNYTPNIAEVFTPGELIFETAMDLVMTVDRVVHGSCKQRTTVPSKPQNVTVVVNGNAIKVSWIPPRTTYSEIGYYISWKNLREPNTTVSQGIVTSHSTVIEVSNPGRYYIYIKAVNLLNLQIGEAATTSVVISTPTILILTTSIQTTYPPGKRPADKKSNIDKVAVACGVTGSVVFLVLVVVVFFKWRMMRRKEHDRSVREFEVWRESHDDSARISNTAAQELMPLNKKTESVPESLSYVTLLEDWGISPKNLKLLDKKLGGGQFGVVKQGLLDTGNVEPEVVAVKMLKEGANETALSNLLSELNILKEVNKHPHPNVIRFIGGCSLEGKLVLVTEFCAGGSLRNFLINSRVKNNSTKKNLTSSLNNRQLLKISVEVASGMGHLSAQKFVHRDLAARNILIGEDNTAKVSDFGLARDIGGVEEYIRSNQNLLPVKWMALESLIHGRFTTASDVWSFGILLHEITTLGEEPYKNISPYIIINHVGSGCRMPKPAHCSSELYDIMKNCWKVNPKDRPTFSEIKEILYGMQCDNERSHINVQQVT